MIPDSVNHIGVHVFAGCSSLTNATVDSGTAYIGEYVFTGCTNLIAVVLKGAAPFMEKARWSLPSSPCGRKAPVRVVNSHHHLCPRPRRAGRKLERASYQRADQRRQRDVARPADPVQRPRLLAMIVRSTEWGLLRRGFLQRPGSTGAFPTAG